MWDTPPLRHLAFTYLFCAFSRREKSASERGTVQGKSCAEGEAGKHTLQIQIFTLGATNCHNLCPAVLYIYH